MTNGATLPADERRYAAIRARDARFDGRFVMAVATTGVYCRPSCPSRTPRRENVSFLLGPAAAQHAGYRACLRCRPDQAPGTRGLGLHGPEVERALALIDEGVLDGDGVAGLAARLGYTPRSVNRILTDATGAGALAHARARRGRAAHQLLTATDLPLSDVAFAAGFGSIRQFNDTIRALFGTTPSELRARSTPVAPGRVVARLAVREPFDFDGLLDWFAARTVPGIDLVVDVHSRTAHDGPGAGTARSASAHAASARPDRMWLRSLHLPRGPGTVVVRRGSPGTVLAELRLTDLRDYAAAVAAVRRLLDLDADPLAIDEAVSRVPQLVGLVRGRPGVRIPGTPTGAEALTWAITGQQIAAVRARDLIHRLAAHGEALPVEVVVPATADHAGLDRLFPTSDVVAAAAGDWFRGPRARRAALVSALGAAASGELDLGSDRPPSEVRADLLALRGVGPWTADYALLRGFRAPDVLPSPDAALLNAARAVGLADDHGTLRAALAPLSPWRSYAAMQLWHRAAQAATPRTAAARTAPTSSDSHQEVVP